MDIPRIYHGYTSIDIPYISMYIRGIYMMDIHGYLCIYQIYPPRWIYLVYPWIYMDILGISIRTAYTWDIHGIFHVYT